MKHNSLVLRQYYRSIKNNLHCPRKGKKAIITCIQSSVHEFLRQNPDADFAAVEDHFGTPESIAEAHFSPQYTSAQIRRLKLRNKIVAWAAASLTAMLLLTVHISTLWITDLQESSGGYFTEEIVKEASLPITEPCRGYRPPDGGYIHNTLSESDIPKSNIPENGVF